MKPEVVIAMYRPKKGHEAELRKLVAKHYPTLHEYGLVTERQPVLARAKDDTFIEVFEWRSKDATRKAHELPAVAQIWEAMEVHGSFATLNSLSEAEHQFPHFEPIDLVARPGSPILGVYGTLYYVRDMKKATEFYKTLLEIAPSLETSHWTTFDQGAQKICLHLAEPDMKDLPGGVVILKVTAIRSFVEGLKSKNTRILTEPKNVGGNDFSADFYDEDGNIVSLVGPLD